MTPAAPHQTTAAMPPGRPYNSPAPRPQRALTPLQPQPSTSSGQLFWKPFGGFWKVIYLLFPLSTPTNPNTIPLYIRSGPTTLPSYFTHLASMLAHEVTSPLFQDYPTPPYPLNPNLGTIFIGYRLSLLTPLPPTP